MANDKLRRQIALDAARLMYERVESEYYTAKRKAAKQLCRKGVKPEDLPSNAEIRDQIQHFARIHEGDRRTENLRTMRLQALKLMRLLRGFRPRLIGSVMTGHVRKGSDIDIHIFTDSVGLVTDILENEGYQFDVERKQVVKHQESRVFTHIHIFYVFRSSVTGKAIERASIRELEELLAREYPGIDLDQELHKDGGHLDPYQLYRMLLLPLEDVRQSAQYHPEGEVLYHSLQVFELARDQRPYDEEFLLAALLHDVGKGLDPTDHVAAGLAALDGVITDRTRFFIEHHMEAHDYQTGKLPAKKRRELESSPDFDDLMLLHRLDDQGRVPGVPVETVDEALNFLKELERSNG